MTDTKSEAKWEWIVGDAESTSGVFTNGKIFILKQFDNSERGPGYKQTFEVVSALDKKGVDEK